jgi:anaphase-promoting complex subunit 3
VVGADGFSSSCAYINNNIAFASPRATMALSTGHVASQLRHLIYYHLDNNLVRNALFLAGRLHAYEPRSFEAQYLLSLCHLHNGEVKAAMECSQGSGSRGLHVGSAYVYAQACLDLGKYVDGITALERSKSLWASKNHWSMSLPTGTVLV